MIKYAVNYVKNTFMPVKVPENVELEKGQFILVRTEKGEEAVKVQLVNSEISKLWENKKEAPIPFEFIRVMTQKDLETLEEIRKEEVTSFFKCKELVERLKLGMNLVQCRLTFDKRKITFYYTAPERVDYRELLKELTQEYKHVRID